MKEPESDLVSLAFKARRDLIERVDAAAKSEGLTRAAVARRALLRDLDRESPNRSDAA